MSNELIVSVSGVRGIVGAGLTAEVVERFAAMFGTHLGGGPVLLSRDSRPHGVLLRDAAKIGLERAGCIVGDAGILPTPTAGFAVRELGCVGGLQITASHNPAPWNGLKMFGRDGAVLPAKEGEVVRKLYEANSPIRKTHTVATIPMSISAAADLHAERVLSLVDVERIRSNRFAVLLDANGGAGGPLGLDLLGSLACAITSQACEPDGDFKHEPEPTPANLPEVAAIARRLGIPAFCLDPDADRLALIDETGKCLSEELTLALAVQFRLSQETGPVVVNMSTSRVIADLCNRAGVSCQRAAVGEANVVERMRGIGALIGGEGNGGVIDPRVGWVRDPFVGMGLILNLMAETGKPLSQLARELPAYEIVKEKVPLPRERLAPALAALEGLWRDATADRLDGLRLDWPDRWLHVRGSNTEPIVRVIAEAPTRAEAELMCRDAGIALQQ